jgi:ribosomal protein L29
MVETKKTNVKEKSSKDDAGAPKAEKKSKAKVSKIKDLKIELLKNPTKRGSIKKEIARLLTMENNTKSEDKK